MWTTTRTRWLRRLAAAALTLCCGTPGLLALTVSGTITAPGGGPAAGVTVLAGFPGEWRQATSDDGGAYSVTVDPGLVMVVVRPPAGTAWADRSFVFEDLEEDLSLDVALSEGVRLQGRLLDPEGRPVEEPYTVELDPLSVDLPEHEHDLTWVDPVDGSFTIRLPADVYWIRVPAPWPYFSPYVPVDLRAGDVTDRAVTLSPTPLRWEPDSPPVGSRITVGSSADDFGAVTVSGAAGAVTPLTRVVVADLETSIAATSQADASGAFTLHLPAPPGTHLMIQGIPPRRDVPQAFPKLSRLVSSTILPVPWEMSGGQGLAFSQAAGFGFSPGPGDGEGRLAGYWLATGTLGAGRADNGALAVEPGDTVPLTGRIELHGPGITEGLDPGEVVLQLVGVSLQPLFDASGRQVPPVRSYESTVLTPTGLPVEEAPIFPGTVPAGLSVELGPLSRSGSHGLVATFTGQLAVPEDLPAGVYRPVVKVLAEGSWGPSDWEWSGSKAQQEPVQSLLLPPLAVGAPGGSRRLVTSLFFDDGSQGVRGSLAEEDQGHWQLSTRVVTQGAPYILEPTDRRTGALRPYVLRPFIPVGNHGYVPPVLPFRVPGGTLTATIRDPDGAERTLGPTRFTGLSLLNGLSPFGEPLNFGSSDHPGLMALEPEGDDFTVTFDRYGEYRITLEGRVEDVWGGTHPVGGTFDVWVADPLDVGYGVLPGTPLEVGDTFNPTLQLLPGVPAEVELTFTLAPASDPSGTRTWSVSGRANRFGYFDGGAGGIVPDAPGEYRVDLTARYRAPDGRLLMAAATWGGVVMTPAEEAELVAHGRRGVDCQTQIPSAWFISRRDLVFPEGAVCHTYNPYLSGDILWSRDEDGPWGGDALEVMASVQDPTGTMESRIRSRLATMNPEEDFTDRIQAGELPLFSATSTGLPVVLDPGHLTQVAYAYRYAERPGVRVRESVSEDVPRGDYWRLNTQYDGQFGVGSQGDEPNDFKFEFVGTVFRDLEHGESEYGGQASLWVYLSPDDPVGTRVMPPFPDAGNDGWPTDGGPIMTLDGEAVDLFFLPTGLAPGSILETGQRFRLAGQVGPPLPSEVTATVTSPSGETHTFSGTANRIGYFADPADDFVVDEPGVWTVDLTVRHTGRCSGGQTVPPYPEGSVLGASEGRFEVYVVKPGSPPVKILRPQPGFLAFGPDAMDVPLRAVAPPGPDAGTVDLTVTMPGFVLDHRHGALGGALLDYPFDPVALHDTFPNLDLVGTGTYRPGLADTIRFTLLVQRGGTACAGSLTLQGDEVTAGASSPLGWARDVERSSTGGD